MDGGGEAGFLTQWCMGESMIDAVFRGVNGTGCELGSRFGTTCIESALHM